MKTNIKHIIKTVLLFSVLITLTSCDKMLKETKYAFINPEDIVDSDAGATLWTIGVYNKLLDDLFRWGNFPLVLEFDSDYMTGPSWSFLYVGAGNFQGSEHISLMWGQLYTLIHRANMAIEQINKMTNLTPVHKDNLLGELNFLKAYSYFLLVRAFGDVPIYYSSIYKDNDLNKPREPIKTVYEHIITLLKDAETKMYKNTNSNFVAGRASAGAAASLLAKVYVTIGSASKASGNVIVRGGTPTIKVGSSTLYTDPVDIIMQKTLVAGYETLNSSDYFKLAKDKAQQVMNGEYGTYDLLPYNELWSLNSHNKTEHIWSLQAKSADEIAGVVFSRGYTGTVDARGNVTTGMWWGCRDHWYKLFEAKDYRVAKGVIHRWTTVTSAVTKKGYYYPNTEDWKKKVTGYTDALGTVIPPEAPYNDGFTYSSGNTYFYLAFLNKYYDVTDRTLERTDANWPFLRYADVLLIYAEAANEANNGPTTEALEAINKVRRRSNATEKTLSGTGNINDVTLFRSAVIEERAMELALEGDRRWDLIRWGIYLQAMNSIGTVDEIGTTKNRESKHLLYPLPALEIVTNKSINGNNPGWN